MFNVGAGELIFIVVAALLVLGPQKLPEFARAIGKLMREFRRQTDEVRTVVEREFYKMDQELIDEPRPKVPPPIPAALPSPVPAAPPPVAPSPVAADSPEAVVATSTPVPGPEAPANGTPSPSVEAPAAGAEQGESLPRLEPIPGTVARNAPKLG
jgi:sec-independent protein translocase protein TatB